jgi:hypothetical protein
MLYTKIIFISRGIKMRSGTLMMAIGVVAMLVIAGAAVLFMTQDNEDVNALANAEPIVSIESTAEGDTILVVANVSGENMPLSGVQVSICKMNIATNGSHTTYRVMEMTTLQTGGDGKVSYNLSAGEKYLICAENQNRNQRGFANQNMNQTEAQACYQHQWDWENMEGQSFQYTNQMMVQG